MNILNISDAASLINNRNVVFITGVTGQDGSYMVDYLLKNTDYMIFGGVRRLSVPNHANLKNVDWSKNRFALVNFDLSDAHAINAIVKELKPDFFINLAAQTFVGSSWDFPAQTWEYNTTGVIHILEAIRQHKPICRFYNAGCHSSDTRVLTPNGLKNYKEMKTGDLVYSLNPKNKNLELKKITKLFEYDYNGELFEFKQGGLLVTPNHKMFYKTKSNNILVKNAEDFIKLADVKYPTNNPCKGNMLDEITDLSNFIPIQKKKGNKNYGNHVTKINTYDLMYLIGIYIGDGSCRIMKKKKKVTSLLETRIRNGIGQYVSDNNAVEFEVEYQCPQTIIDIPPTDVCFAKVIKTLEINNIKWKLYGKCDITMHQWGLVSYFSECGNSAVQKHIPSWIFDLDSSYQLKVLEGIRDSDGDDRDVISTVSPQLQFDLLKLHINCGIMPTFGERPPRTSVLKDGRQIKGNYPERWIHGLKENIGYQRGNYKKINYTGKVWCFEVEDNHNFIVERCGKLTFSGNSSEEYGNVEYTPQDETHPSKPRSPYGASKAAARQLVKVYRESYNLYAVQGLLFNHECLTENTPILIKYINTGLVDIKSISELVPHRKNPKKGKKYTTINSPDFLVWDGGKWSRVLTRTATWNDSTEKHDKKIKQIECRGTYYEATADHISFLKGEIEIKTENIVTGSKLELKPLPDLNPLRVLTQEEAEFLGMMVAEGCVKKSTGTIVNKNKNFIDRASYLWKKITNGYTNISFTESGFKKGNYSYCLNLRGDISYLDYIRDEIYTFNKFKRIPLKILNSDKSTILAFLRGYNAGDGTKTCNQNSEFQCFTTNSQVLAAGLWWICDKVLNIRTILNVENRGKYKYFRINLNVENSNKGNHLIKPLDEVKNKTDINYDGWLFDLETESGTFSAGIGFGWVHNSPRRGEEFVTRKITKGVAHIKKALIEGKPFNSIELGNVYAKRDWSDAEDFVDAIWRMLNQDLYNKLWLPNNPIVIESCKDIKSIVPHLKEYVVSSNETHTIKEFIELAFKTADINGGWHGNGINEEYSISVPDALKYDPVNSVLVKINPKFYRPAEVDLLLGDSNLARRELGWQPKTSFSQLVEKMVLNDLRLEGV
jgi:GDPmannose 4,6-dehydratase